VGWHVEPLSSVSVQLPRPPLVGAVDASHAKFVTSNIPKPSAADGTKMTLPLLAVAAPWNLLSVEMVELMSTSAKLLSLGSNTPTPSALYGAKMTLPLPADAAPMKLL
jgi:hypothetical protein